MSESGIEVRKLTKDEVREIIEAICIKTHIARSGTEKVYLAHEEWRRLINHFTILFNEDFSGLNEVTFPIVYCLLKPYLALLKRRIESNHKLASIYKGLNATFYFVGLLGDVEPTVESRTIDAALRLQILEKIEHAEDALKEIVKLLGDEEDDVWYDE